MRFGSRKKEPVGELPKLDRPAQETTMDIRRHIHNNDKLLIDYYPETNGKKRYYRFERWTSEPTEEIIRKGYLKGINFHDETKYFGAKIFVKFSGFQQFDINQLQKPIKVTSSNLYSFYCSETQKRFMDGMTRIAFSPIDTKMLIMIGAVAIGGILGMMYFMA